MDNRALRAVVHAERQAALARLMTTFGEYGGRDLLQQLASPSVLDEFDRLADLATACASLSAGASRAEVRERLMRRGLSYASAYRVISAALEELRPSCITEGPSLRRSAPILGASLLTEDLQSMEANEGQTIVALQDRAPVRELARRRDELKAELDSIDLTLLQGAARKAEDSYEELRCMKPANALARFLNPERHQEAVRNAYARHKAARDQHLEATRRASALAEQISSLDAMLTASARGAQARQDLLEAERGVEAAEQSLRDSEQALESITGLISEAERAFEEAKANAAAAVLAAVKSGGGAGKVATPSRDRVETLIAAKQSALQEIEVARRSVGVARARCDALRQLIGETNAGVRKLAEHVAKHAYEEAFAQIVAAHTIEIDS